MKSKTRLDYAVFQLTPTRTRCDLFIISNDKKEKIASGLLNPFLVHLKTAQLQIQQGGYSVFLQPPPSSDWFTKSTLQSFVRFVSTPEILERVCTIESEILQIQEAIAIQNLPSSLVQDQPLPPSSDHVVNQDKAIVLYSPETTNLSAANQGNSKLQLLNVLDTRKTVLKKEQGMAFARAMAAGFDVDQVAHLVSFAECFGASRLMSACLSFTDLWKHKHESGQWLEIQPEAENAMSTKSDYSPSGIGMTTNTDDAICEIKETAAGTDPTAGGQQQYHTTGQFPHPGFPPWAMHSSPGGVAVYQPYPMHPYYQQHYPAGVAPFYPAPPYPPYPTSSSSPMDINNSRYTNSESEETSEQHKNGSGKSNKPKSGRVIIRNINFINSKSQNSSSGDDNDESDTDDETVHHTQHPKRKDNRKDPETEIPNGKETDGVGHWGAFQSYLLKGAAEGDRSSANEDMFAMEKDSKTKSRQKTMHDNDPLTHAERDDAGGEDHRMDMQSYYRNGRKIMYSTGNDDFMIGGREEANVRNSLADNRFEASLNRNGLQHAPGDEAVMVSVRSASGVNDNRSRSSINMVYYNDLPLSGNKNLKNNEQVKYEPDALSLMPERDVEKKSIGYDPALDYEMQIAEDAASREKKSKEVKKGGPKSAEKQQQSKTSSKQGGSLGKKFVGKGRPSKVNNTLEDARARAEKLRSYKADLQKMKKQQQDAEHERLEALKMERQNRIAARGNPSRQSVTTNKVSPMSHRGAGSKFTDSEPGSSSPLQRSKIRPASIGSTSNSKKPSTSKLIDGNHSAGNRLTRSLSSMSDTKKEINSVTPVSMTRIRRLSEPKKINNTRITTTTKTQGVSKAKLSNGSQTKKITAIINLDLPELKIKTSKLSSNLTSQKEREDNLVATSKVVKPSLNNTSLHTDDNPIIIDKSVVMLEHKQKQPSISSNHGAGHVVDKETISVQPQKHPISGEVGKDSVDGTSCSEYQPPYARVSSFEDPCTRNSEYAKAPHTNFGTVSGNEKAYISEFNNLKLEKIPEIVEKPQAKGFRRLLKLGKKSQSASGNDDNAQVGTLKSVISEDETPASNGKKSSRHFSLLSSFRGK